MKPEYKQLLKLVVDEIAKINKRIDGIQAEVSTVVYTLSKETPEDARIVRTASLMAAKMSALEKGEPGAPGTPGTKGDPGAPGKNGKDGANGKDGKNGIDGKNGKDGVDGKDGAPGKDGSPQTGEEIVLKINALDTDPDHQIDARHIKNFERIAKDVERLSNRPMTSGIAGRDLFTDIDLTNQLDGVTKTFNIQGVWNIISVSLASYPYGTLRKNVDYTFTPTSITFTDTIDATTQLAAGQQCVITAIKA